MGRKYSWDEQMDNGLTRTINATVVNKLVELEVIEWSAPTVGMGVDVTNNLDDDERQRLEELALDRDAVEREDALDRDFDDDWMDDYLYDDDIYDDDDDLIDDDCDLYMDDEEEAF
jgi:hypothetical protein